MNKSRERRPRILVIHTGGTFGMLPARSGFSADLGAQLPELHRLARFHIVTPFVTDSSSMTPERWVELARLVDRALPKWDGFVITHGTDTMAYTAAALSFLLQGLRKPVVLTGAQRPLSAVRSDARVNFLDALEVAGRGLKEVVIVFGGLVLRGNRARKRSLSDYRAFESPNLAPLGEIGTGLSLFEERLLRPRGRYRLRPEIDPRVIHLRLVPGMPPCALSALDPKLVRGVILEAFGAGNVPVNDDSVPDAIRRLVRAGTVVVVASGSEHGVVDLDLYEGGRAAKAAGAIGASDMVAEAAVTKLMIALGRSRSPAEAKEAFLAPWAGEMRDGEWSDSDH